MDENELEPKIKEKKLKNLEEMSIQGLQKYIIELETEINRVKVTIKEKLNALEGAKSFFKT